MEVGDFVEWSGRYGNPMVPPGTVGVVVRVKGSIDVRFPVRGEDKLIANWAKDAWRLHKNSYVKQFIIEQKLV